MQHKPDDVRLRHLARVIESSDDAIVSKDLNGIITSWNRAAETMFGYSAAEAIGQSIRMIIPADRQSEEDMVLGGGCV
jgi:PAS domain S-box-containing protein